MDYRREVWKKKRTFEYSHYCHIHASQGEVTDSHGSRSAYETVLKESQWFGINNQCRHYVEVSQNLIFELGCKEFQKLSRGTQYGWDFEVKSNISVKKDDKSQFN